MMTAVHFPDARKVRGGREPPGLDRLGDGRGLDVFDIAPPRVQGLDLGRVNIQPQHLRARARELERQGQADVTQTNNGDFHRY